MINLPSPDFAERAIAASALPSQDDSQLAAADSTKSPFNVASSFRASALVWFGFGLDVIPILPGTKQPVVKWDQWLLRLSPGQINAHWVAHPTHEVGFIVGDCVIVFDADSPKAVDALNEAEPDFGVLPSMIVKTVRGEHHYYKKSPELLCKTTSVIVGDANDRIDIKTGRTMVILPPSTGKVLVKVRSGTLEHASQMSEAPLELLEHFGALVIPRKTGHSVRLVTASAPSESNMRLLAAGLKRLSADCSYEPWLRIGAIIFHVSGGTQEGLTCFDNWSSASTKYKAREVCAKWKSFRLDHPKPLTMASFRFLLTEQGHDWLDILMEAGGMGEDFQVVDTEVL